MEMYVQAWRIEKATKKLMNINHSRYRRLRINKRPNTNIKGHIALMNTWLVGRECPLVKE